MQKGLIDMPEKMTELSCREFSEQLASKEPVPGGGGAAALVASAAASLCSMAAGLTAGKKRFLPFEDDLKRILTASDELRERFLSLIEEDASAFSRLSKAYSLDRSLPENADVFRAATLDAAKVPFELLRRGCDLVTLLEDLREKCSVLLLSDVGCAAAALKGAMESAGMNVFVNTRLLKDDTEAIELAAKAQALLAEYLPRAQAISDSVTAFLKGSE